MKKIALLTLLSSALVCGAFAQSSKPTKEKTPTTISCAVMPSETVNIAKATKNKMYADYKGRRYFFCCNGCPQAFKKDPAKFAKSASIPAPVEKKHSKKNG